MLIKSLNKIKYPTYNITQEVISKQNPVIFLQILHYTVIDYSKEIYQMFLDKNYQLCFKSDLGFLQNIYKLMIKEMCIKPEINVKNFLENRFIEKKMNLCHMIIQKIISIEEGI